MADTTLSDVTNIQSGVQSLEPKHVRSRRVSPATAFCQFLVVENGRAGVQVPAYPNSVAASRPSEGAAFSADGMGTVANATDLVSATVKSQKAITIEGARALGKTMAEAREHLLTEAEYSACNFVAADGTYGLTKLFSTLSPATGYDGTDALSLNQLADAALEIRTTVNDQSVPLGVVINALGWEHLRADLETQTGAVWSNPNTNPEWIKALFGNLVYDSVHYLPMHNIVIVVDPTNSLYVDGDGIVYGFIGVIPAVEDANAKQRDFYGFAPGAAHELRPCLALVQDLAIDFIDGVKSKEIKETACGRVAIVEYMNDGSDKIRVSATLRSAPAVLDSANGRALLYKNSR